MARDYQLFGVRYILSPGDKPGEGSWMHAIVEQRVAAYFVLG
jgi:hypothetical protein